MDKDKITNPESEISQHEEKAPFKSSFKTWIRIVAFIVVAVFLPEIPAQAMEYDWRVLWQKPGVSTFVPNTLGDLRTVDIPLTIKNILTDISGKQINAIQLAPNLTVKLDKPLNISKARIEEIYNWLKGKPCGSKAIYDYLSYKGAQNTEQDVAVFALTVDILSDVVQPQGEPKVIKNSLYALARASEFFSHKLYAVKLTGPNTELPAPFIAHLNPSHYVLVTRVSDGKVYYSDNHTEKYLSLDKFQEKFSGYALVEKIGVGMEALSEAEAKKVLGADAEDDTIYQADIATMDTGVVDNYAPQDQMMQEFVDQTPNVYISEPMSAPISMSSFNPMNDFSATPAYMVPSYDNFVTSPANTLGPINQDWYNTNIYQPAIQQSYVPNIDNIPSMQSFDAPITPIQQSVAIPTATLDASGYLHTPEFSVSSVPLSPDYTSSNMSLSSNMPTSHVFSDGSLGVTFDGKTTVLANPNDPNFGVVTPPVMELTPPKQTDIAGARIIEFSDNSAMVVPEVSNLFSTQPIKYVNVGLDSEGAITTLYNRDQSVGGFDRIYNIDNSVEVIQHHNNGGKVFAYNAGLEDRGAYYTDTGFTSIGSMPTNITFNYQDKRYTGELGMGLLKGSDGFFKPITDVYGEFARVTEGSLIYGFGNTAGGDSLDVRRFGSGVASDAMVKPLGDGKLEISPNGQIFFEQNIVGGVAKNDWQPNLNGPGVEYIAAPGVEKTNTPLDERISIDSHTQIMNDVNHGLSVRSYDGILGNFYTSENIRFVGNEVGAILWADEHPLRAIPEVTWQGLMAPVQLTGNAQLIANYSKGNSSAGLGNHEFDRVTSQYTMLSSISDGKATISAELPDNDSGLTGQISLLPVLQAGSQQGSLTPVTSGRVWTKPYEDIEFANESGTNISGVMIDAAGNLGDIRGHKGFLLDDAIGLDIYSADLKPTQLVNQTVMLSREGVSSTITATLKDATLTYSHKVDAGTDAYSVGGQGQASLLTSSGSFNGAITQGTLIIGDDGKIRLQGGLGDSYLDFNNLAHRGDKPTPPTGDSLKTDYFNAVVEVVPGDNALVRVKAEG
ncbi:MAG: cysteine peptidase family C39 domain-containing protein [Candidatus Omnitrophica bacterium]|nr:cysteine peptidase family C39 domain-containing protein [Candidatus Omnitrophota bacterium]